MTENLSGTLVDMLALPVFWLFLVAILVFEAMLPIHRQPVERRGRLITNFGLGVINAALFSLLPLSTVIAAKWADDRGFGLMALIPVSGAIAFVATILLRSLTAYALHMLVHRVPILWRIHRVHHADTAVDLSTGFRHHPFELFLVAAGNALAAVALGLSWPALIAYESGAVLFSLWTHANLRLPAPVEAMVRLLLVTPAMHHAHHSAFRPQTDSNYGELFSFWDRLFGTHSQFGDEDLRAMRIGLGSEHDEGSGRIWTQLRTPFAAERRGSASLGASQPR